MADLFGHGSRTPVRATSGHRFERLADRRGDLIVTDFAWCSGARLVVDAVHPICGEPIAPGTGGRRATPHFGGDLFVVQAIGSRQYDPSALSE
jgi:hypothetical protein